MSHRLPPALIALACLAGAVQARTGQEPTDPLAPADAAINRADLERHVRFLAADASGVREAAATDPHRVARYLERTLEGAGLQPAPGEQGFELEIPLVRYEILSAPRMVFTTQDGQEVEAVFGRDFRVIVRGEARSTPELPIRRVDKKHPLPRKALADEALFIVATPRDRAQWLREREMGNGSAWGLDLTLLDRESGDGPPADPPAPRLVTELPVVDACEQVMVRGDLRDRLLDGDFRSVRLTFDEKKTELVDLNVLGVIPGADPALAGQVLLFFASYDAAGSRGRKGADGGPRLATGADDNASGCAALLEVAEALAAGPRPKRTVAFLFLTGGEKLRYGLEDWMKHPAIPLGRTVAALQVERLGRPAPGSAGQLWMTGYERTNLGPAFLEHGLPVRPDPLPEAKYFIRSASYFIGREGVVAQTLSGSDWSTDDPEGDRPETLNFEHLTTCTRALESMARLIADGEVTPAWGEGGPPKKIGARR